MSKSLLLFVFLISGCAVSAHRDGDTLILKGFGVQQATWEKDGEKYSISKKEPFSVPSLVPVR